MGGNAQAWRTQAKVRADEVGRALIRMGYATNGQLARLLNIDVKQMQRLVSREWNLFSVQRKLPIGIAGGRYIILGNRVPTLIQLSSTAVREWAEQEGLRKFQTVIRMDRVPQRLNMMELLIRLRHRGLLYETWDMMLPQDEREGLHAWLTKANEPEYKLGVFLLPMRFTNVEEAQKGHIFQGILRRVTQNSNVENTLFLVTRAYYAAALRSLTVFNKKDGVRFFLLPLESFTERPESYLDAIVTNENQSRHTLIEERMQYRKKHAMPGHYDYAALLEFEHSRYRFVDAYVNGSIDRVRSWFNNTIGYQIPNTGHVATAGVYVPDDIVREALGAVLGMKRKGRYEASIVQVHPWPEATSEIGVKVARPLAQENSVLDDEEWWRVFNE